VSAQPSPAPPSHMLPRDGGRFSWQLGSGRWDWSDSVFRLHGYDPGAVRPSSTLAFQHKHPDDLHSCVDALHAGIEQDRLVVQEHRLVAADGTVRPVLVVCRPVGDRMGSNRVLRGFLLPTSCDHEGSHPAASGLTLMLMTFFAVDQPAAELLAACRRLPSLRRSPQDQVRADAQRTSRASMDTRQLIEDSLFPAEHFQPSESALAA